MIIESVSKAKKKNLYNVIIDKKVYEFNEDIIIEFNLYKGKEIDDELLNKALSSNSINDYYNNNFFDRLLCIQSQMENNVFCIGINRHTSHVYAILFLEKEEL